VAEHDIALTVNGTAQRLRVESRRTLADTLRDDLGLTGTHLGCEHGACGACTVLVDDEPQRSCLVFAAQLDGCRVTTVEGLCGADGSLSVVQEAFRQCHGLQCGFCTPGFVVTVSAFLAETPAPDEDQIRDALSGNLCRCTGYQGIIAAVRHAAATLAGEEAQ
jgi:aerobic carbon-monoxide dehydrogenase small subunit